MKPRVTSLCLVLGEVGKYCTNIVRKGIGKSLLAKISSFKCLLN